MNQNRWLIGIDFQRVFEAGGQWGCPDYDLALTQLRRLLPAYTGRTVLTRFVSPATPKGAWAHYYKQNAFAIRSDNDPIWDISESLSADKTLVTTPATIATRSTFGKWDDELSVALDHPAEIVIAGVSTDCCVLSTALAAADGGVAVTVVEDACAAASADDHDRALRLLRNFAPLIHVETARQHLARTVPSLTMPMPPSPAMTELTFAQSADTADIRRSTGKR